MGIRLREIIILSLILIFVHAAVGQPTPFVKVLSEKKLRGPDAGKSKGGSLFRLKHSMERERKATLEAKANAVDALENDSEEKFGRRALKNDEKSGETDPNQDRRALRNSRNRTSRCPRRFQLTQDEKLCIRRRRTRSPWDQSRAEKFCGRLNSNLYYLSDSVVYCSRATIKNRRRSLKGTEGEKNNEPNDRRELKSARPCPPGFKPNPSYPNVCLLKRRTPVQWSPVFAMMFCKSKGAHLRRLTPGFVVCRTFVNGGFVNGLSRRVLAGTVNEAEMDNESDDRRVLGGLQSICPRRFKRTWDGKNCIMQKRTPHHQWQRGQARAFCRLFRSELRGDVKPWGFICIRTVGSGRRALKGADENSASMNNGRRALQGLEIDESELEYNYDQYLEEMEMGFGYEETGEYIDLEYLDEQEIGCLEGWTESEGECFQYVKTQLNFNRAEEYCQKIHPEAHLATIQSEIQNEVVSNLAEGHSENFIGLKFDTEFGGLTWTSGEDVDYTAKWHHETGSNSDLCTRLVGGEHRWKPAHWDDWACTKSSRFFCSYSLDDEEEEDDEEEDNDAAQDFPNVPGDEKTCVNVRVTVVGDTLLTEFSGDYVQLPIEEINEKPVRLSETGFMLFHDDEAWAIMPMPSQYSTLEYLVEHGSSGQTNEDDMPENGFFTGIKNDGYYADVMVEFECIDEVEEECNENEANMILGNSFKSGFLPPWMKDCASLVDSFGSEICDVPMEILGMILGGFDFFGPAGLDLISDRCPVSCGACESDNCNPIDTPFNGVYHKTDEIMNGLPVYVEDTNGYRLFHDVEVWVFDDPNEEIGIMAELIGGAAEYPEDNAGWVVLSRTSASEKFENVPIRGCSAGSECKTLTVGACEIHA